MKKILDRWLLPILLTLPMMGCTQSSRGSLAIALTGDSITAGVIGGEPVSDENGRRFDPCSRGLCFARKLAEKVSERTAELGVEDVAVINVGVGGATSRDWDPSKFFVNDWHFRWNRNRPLFENVPAANVVVHYVGAGDATAHLEGPKVDSTDDVPPTSMEEYAAHLIAFKATLHRRGVKYVLFITPPIPDKWSGPDSSEGRRMRQYAEATRVACASFPRSGPCLIDIQDEYHFAWRPAWEIHPSREGHAWIALRVFEAVAPLLGLER